MAQQPKRIPDEEINRAIPSIVRAAQNVAHSPVGTGEVVITIDRGHIVSIDFRAKGRTWHGGKPVEQPAAD